MLSKSEQEGITSEHEDKPLCDLDSPYAYAAAILAELLETRKKAHPAQVNDSSTFP